LTTSAPRSPSNVGSPALVADTHLVGAKKAGDVSSEALSLSLEMRNREAGGRHADEAGDPRAAWSMREVVLASDVCHKPERRLWVSPSSTRDAPRSRLRMMRLPGVGPVVQLPARALAAREQRFI
jgi:hypothetical protein